MSPEICGAAIEVPAQEPNLSPYTRLVSNALVSPHIVQAVVLYSAAVQGNIETISFPGAMTPFRPACAELDSAYHLWAQNHKLLVGSIAAMA